MDILNPKIKYDSLTTIKWLAKSFCKVPLYMELAVNYHKLLMYLALTYLLLINFYPFYILWYSSTIKIVLVQVIMILAINFIIVTHLKLYTPDAQICLITVLAGYGCFVIIMTNMVNRKLQSIDVFSTNFFSFLLVLFFIGNIKFMIPVVSQNTALGPVNIHVNTALTNIWKHFSVFSTIIYILILVSSDLSYTPTALSILVIGLLYCIVYNYKSAYAIALIIILFVSYNIFALYKSWSSNSSVFLISQATSQLTVVGALLQSTGYTKLWKKTAD